MADLRAVDLELKRLIESRDTAGLQSLKDLLPAAVLSVLTRTFQPSANADTWVAVGKGLAQVSLANAALECLAAALTAAPQAAARAGVYAERGTILQRYGKAPEAAKDFAAAARLDTAFAERAAASLPPLPIYREGPWHVVGHTDPNYQALAATIQAPEIDDNPCRDDLALSWHRRDISPLWGAVTNCSFIVTYETRAVIKVPCDIRGDASLRCGEVPLVLGYGAGFSERDMAAATDIALDYLRKTAAHVGARWIELEDETRPVMTPVSAFAGDRLDQGATISYLRVDLIQGPERLRGGLRKGHRHAVGWGEKNMPLRSWAEDTERPALLRAYFDVHARAGRVPPFSSPEELGHFLESEKADLLVALFEGAATCVVLTTDHPLATYYRGGASIDHESHAVSHWPVFAAMRRAQERGQRYFDFGYLETDPRFPEKLQAIAHFKRGFATGGIETAHQWWSIPA